MRALLLLVLLAAADRAWEQKEFDCERPKSCDDGRCCEYGLAVFTREKAGVDVKEVKAVGQVDAPPSRVFEVVTDYEHQVGNMPYVQDQAVFSRTEKDVTFWAIADFPLVSRRDWIVKSRLEKDLPGGAYRAAWEPTHVEGAPAPEDGVIRLRVNSGSWTMEPIDGGKRTLATYQLLTDPGGSIPTFVANKANTKALPELFARVRKRAEAK
ncbi:MAG: hypothetical protein LC689_19505 [Myxococcales bacterium]|nr:hypothetical protein [Myxococcales bacterium]